MIIWSTHNSTITFKRPLCVAPSTRGDRGCGGNSSDETDDQGVTLDILRVAGEVKAKFSPSKRTFESDCSDWDSSVITPRKTEPHIGKKRSYKNTFPKGSNKDPLSESVHYINDSFYDSLSSGPELENSKGKQEKFSANSFQNSKRSEQQKLKIKRGTRQCSLSPVIQPIREQLYQPIIKQINMSESDTSSSDSDKSSDMTKLKSKKRVDKSSSSESESSENDKHLSKGKKKKLNKSRNHSDSDSSHIEPSQFRSPKLNTYQISKKSPEKTKSPKSIKKSPKSHDISSNSEDESEVESPRRKRSPRKRKLDQTSDDSSDSKITGKTSTESPRKMKKMQNGKSKSPGKGKSSHKLSKCTVLLSSDEDGETPRTKSTKKSKSFPSKNSSREERESTDLSDLHKMREDKPEDLELWLIKVPAKVPLSSLPEQVMINGIQDFSKDNKRYELISFTDEMVQRDHVSFVQGASHQLLEGPRVKGQMQIVSKPSAPLRPVTAPIISHKPVPFPSGLKVRFTPFGADAPALLNKSPRSKKHKKKRLSENEDTTLDSVEDADVSPRKKKKKKKKHSSH